MIVQNILIKSDAVIAAWLPGTSGGHGIVDAISGSYNLKPSTSSNSNSLSFNWPADMVFLILYRKAYKIIQFMDTMEKFLK